jgi:EAL domain-containing protein (putative c-di-GMP-specific phosphodiesterase class I)/GGDEF domain-containing protein
MNSSRYLDSLLAEGAFSPLRSILFDGVTGLPTLPLVIETLKDTAAEQHRLGIIYIDTARLQPVEEEQGWEFVDQLYRHVREFLDTILHQFAPYRIFPMHRMIGDNFLLVVTSSDPQKPISDQKLGLVAGQLEQSLNEYLTARLAPSILPFGRMFHGHAMLEFNSDVRFERLLNRTINLAFQNAVNSEQKVYQSQVRQLQEIVNANRIHIFLQPIFNLQNLQEILGHESLSRGPAGTPFESADFMFSLANNCGMLNRLENLCQLRLISSLQKESLSHLIFINLEPSFLENDQYRKLALFNHEGVHPDQVVIEITERVAIQDYDMVARALDDIRNRGFRVAVDDVGSGYASLQSLAYIKPNYIKINEKMVSGIDSDFIKQEIVHTLRQLGSRFSASLIAEGIEDPKDMMRLRELNIPFGQGFLLQRPSERAV